MLKLVDATELAGYRLWQLRRARRGAALARRRLLEALDAAPVITQSSMGPVKDLTGTNAWTVEHDLSYYAWEAVKILNIARKVRGDHRVQAALDVVAERSPELEAFRNAVTHPEDNRTFDDVLFAGAAMRLRPGMQPEYVIDPRSACMTRSRTLSQLRRSLCSQQPGLSLMAWSGPTTADATWSDPVSGPAAASWPDGRWLPGDIGTALRAADDAGLPAR
jgi:hypothetical protein